jgi:hypothetical protein
MSILDLQGMQAPSEVRAGNSGASKDCFNTGGGHHGGHVSTLSVALC